MKTEEEIRQEIDKHGHFIRNLDYKYDYFANIEEQDSRSWINALEWVLEEK